MITMLCTIISLLWANRMHLKYTWVVFRIYRMDILVLLPDQLLLLLLFFTPEMSILQMQHSQGASNLDLHTYFGYWQIVSSCTDQSALVRLAPEAYFSSLKSTHSSLPSASAVMEGRFQKRRNRPKNLYLHSFSCPLVAGLSISQFF